MNKTFMLLCFGNMTPSSLQGPEGLGKKSQRERYYKVDTPGTMGCFQRLMEEFYLPLPVKPERTFLL